MGVGYVPAGEIRQEREGHDVPRREHRGAGANLGPLSPRQLGRLGESIAADFLVRRGATIHQRNVRLQGGELDLLASVNGERVAVEVKTGAADSIGDPEYHFDAEKQRRVRRLATLIDVHRVDYVGVKISTSGVTVRWLPGVW